MRKERGLLEVIAFWEAAGMRTWVLGWDENVFAYSCCARERTFWSCCSKKGEV